MLLRNIKIHSATQRRPATEGGKVPHQPVGICVPSQNYKNLQNACASVNFLSTPGHFQTNTLGSENISYKYQGKYNWKLLYWVLANSEYAKNNIGII